MNISYEGAKANDNQKDYIGSLKNKIKKLEKQIDDLEEENIIFSRRIWFLYSQYLDASYVLAKIEKVLGKEKFKKIFDEYSDEKEGVIEHQIEMAKAGLHTMVFAS